MPMDADALQMLNLLKQMAPLPTAATVAHEYRARQAETQKDRVVVVTEVTRVETFEISGEHGPVRVRLYIDGVDPAPRPALLYMHGGGFVTCSIDTHDGYCRQLAAETGMAVVSVDYRLAPEYPFPIPFDDCRDALLWTSGPEAAAKGIDTAWIAVAGDSAGGAIAAALCLWARDRSEPAIAHQLLIYPVINNDFTTASYHDNGIDYFLTREAMRWFWTQYLGDCDAPADALAAPGRAADLAGLPPATVITAGYDPLRDEGAAYAERLAQAGVEVAYRDFPGTFHGFAGMDMLQSGRDSRAFIVGRLKQASGAV